SVPRRGAGMDRGGPTIVAEQAPARKEVCTNTLADRLFPCHFSHLSVKIRNPGELTAMSGPYTRALPRGKEFRLAQLIAHRPYRVDPATRTVFLRALPGAGRQPDRRTVVQPADDAGRRGPSSTAGTVGFGRLSAGVAGPADMGSQRAL